MLNPKTIKTTIDILKQILKNGPTIIEGARRLKDATGKFKKNTVKALPENNEIKLTPDPISEDLSKHSEELKKHVQVLNGHTKYIKNLSSSYEQQSQQIEKHADLIEELANANQQVSILLRFLLISVFIIGAVSITAIMLAILK